MSAFLRILRAITLVMPVYDAIAKRVREARGAKMEKELQAGRSELAGQKKSAELRRSYKNRPIQGPYGGDDE